MTTTKQKQASDKKQEVRVLDVKRSNAINIGLTVLPPPRTIKAAIIAMDERALTKEQVEVGFLMCTTVKFSYLHTRKRISHCYFFV